MTVGSLNGKPVSTPLANSPYVQVDSNGVFQSASAPSSGNFILVQSQTANNSATLDFTTGLSAYNRLKIIIDGLRGVTNAVQLQMQVSQDSGATWVSTGYACGVGFSAYNATTPNNVNSTSNFLLSGSITNGEAYYADIDITSFNTAFFSGVQGTAVWSDNTVSTIAKGTIGGLGPTGASALRFLMSSGNISIGTITVYGMS